MTDRLAVHEIYLSLQGESTFAGQPCVFVRLTGCNLRCSYCDTAYAFHGGRPMTLEEVLGEASRMALPYGNTTLPDGTRLPLVELTGGEPLLQKSAFPLMGAFCDRGWTVLLETSGAHDVARVDPRVRRILDVKCPSSGESHRNFWENLPKLRDTDEVKFVIGSVEDYDFAKSVLARYSLPSVCPVLFSWVHPLSESQRDPSLRPLPPDQTLLNRQELVERIIADALPVRFQAQLHKLIWAPEARGV